MGKKKEEWYDQVADWSLIVGGVNWGVLAVARQDIFALLGVGGMLPLIVYGVVGVSGVYTLVKKIGWM